MSETNAYLSFIDQTIHYFTRSHDSIPIAPVETAAAWRGDELDSLDELAYRLTSEE